MLDAGFDFFSLASTVDDGGVFLADFHASSLAQVFQRYLVQCQAHFFSDDLTASQDSDVFQHGLATIAKARCLHSHNLQHATDGVHHQGSQCFAFHVFCNDQQRTASLGHLLQGRQQVTDVADLLVEQQHEGVVQNCSLLFRVVDEVGRQVAAVKLHAFHDIQFVGQALAFFHGDHAFLADFVHGLGDDFTHVGVGVGGDRTHLGDFLGSGCSLGLGLQLLHQGSHSLVDTTLQVHGVQTSGHVLGAFAHDGLGQHGSGGGTVTSDVVGLGSHFLDQLSTHVLQLVLQFHFLGHGYTVLGHGGGAEGALQHHVTALGTQSYLHGVGQNVHAFNHAGACFAAEYYVFSCHFKSPNSVQKVGWVKSLDLLFDDGKQVVFLHHQQFFAIDLHGLARVLAEQHAVANLHVQSNVLALVVALAGANSQHFALVRLFSSVVRDIDARSCLCFVLKALDDHAVVQRTQIHNIS